ncbi:MULTISPECIES: alpha/beta hydrolase [unclassified Nocardioides]|uniref:alpha/beta hydrolase n=1 Tax=unclassified Nocardioides TaxID=2615069 RepID=UPI0006FD6A5E|nr:MULTISPECIES: alpha/beta hydrolase [unclassified Nocardioides]KQY64690.1 hypothetical protein ASD30_07240 [Nocardioides sp. Root140]KRF12593.1 hypothetical protein ASH02_13595 [Nocardioides sp. Soil796]
MTDHFSLDVDPESLRAAGRRLKRIVTMLDERAPKVVATPDQIGDQWTGPPASKVKSEMTTLGETLTSARPKVKSAMRAANHLATLYDDALEQLPSLNRRWAETVADHKAALAQASSDQAKAVKEATRSGEIDIADEVRIRKINGGQTRAAASAMSAAQARLTTEFEDLQADLRRDTRDAAREFRENLLVKAPALDPNGPISNRGRVLSLTQWRAQAKEALLTDLPLTDGHYDAVAEEEEWRNALKTHGLEVPADFDKEHGKELVAALDDKLAELEGLDDKARSEAITKWASGLDPTDLSLLAILDAERVGNLDGIPNQARYAANRVNLTAGIEAEKEQLAKYWDPPPGKDDDGWAEYTRLNGRIDMLEELLSGKADYVDPDTGAKVQRPYQTLVFVPPTYDGDKVTDDGRLAAVMGNLDKAKYVGTVVPGITNRIDNFDATLDKAINTHEMAPDSATIAWLGYDTPEFKDASSTEKAEIGGANLKSFTDGLVRAEGSELSIMAHSYGTLVTSKALQAGMRPDRVVLFGSPGLGENINTRDDLGIPDDIPIYALRAPGDPVSITAGHGTDPVDMEGIIRLDTDWSGPEDVTGHSQYTNRKTQSLINIAGVLQGWTVRPDGYNGPGNFLVEGGNPLDEDGLAGPYNENLRALVDELQAEVPNENLERFVSHLETRLQNIVEGGTKPGFDDIPELTDLIRTAMSDSQLGEHLTEQELEQALIDAGFADKTGDLVGDIVRDKVGDFDQLDDLSIPITIPLPGPGPFGGPFTFNLNVPDGANEHLADILGNVTDSGLTKLSELAVNVLPGMEGLLDTADVIYTAVDGVKKTITLVKSTPAILRTALHLTTEKAKDEVIETIAELTVGTLTTVDHVVEGGRNVIEGGREALDDGREALEDVGESISKSKLNPGNWHL